MRTARSRRARRRDGRCRRWLRWLLAAGLVLGLGGCRDDGEGTGPGSAGARAAFDGEDPGDRTPPAPSTASPRGKDRDEVAAARAASGSPKKTEPSAPAKRRGAKGKGGAPEIPPPAVAVVAPAEQLTTEQIRAEVEALREEHEKLRRGIAALTPQEPYILINTTLNRLSVKAGDRFILRDAIVSTGSNTELVEPSGRRRWFFSTPKGVHTVKRKMVAPIWVKPDWAFIEEGEPVPGAQAEARFEQGTLGRYALYFGNGYMIHGTLFQRFLGQSVTHGCVRVGDADLETLYENSKVGTKIYIY